MWSNAEQSRQKQYNCTYCQQEGGRYESRNCFWYGAEEQTIEASQTVEDEQTGATVIKKGEKHTLNDDEFVELVTDIVMSREKLSPFEVLLYIFPKVCPKSLTTVEVDEYITMDSFCRDYHLSPLGGTSYLDYPLQLRAILSTIGLARERVKMKELQEMKAKH